MVDINVENVVASAQIVEEVNLEKFSQILPDSKYKPEEFPGVSMFLDEVALIILSNGKIVCTGAKSLKEAEYAINFVAKKLKGQNLKVKSNIQIQNITASADLGKEIDLERVKRLLGEKVNAPQKFPGLVYKSDDGVTLLLFKSGKIVCIGKSEEEIKKSLEKVVMEIS